jgi:hypothetical protein
LLKTLLEFGEFQGALASNEDQKYRSGTNDRTVGLLQYVDRGSRFVGDVNWCSVVGTGLSGPTLSVL